MRPRSVFTAPSYWPTSAAWSSTCWRAMRWRAKSSSFRRRLRRASLSSAKSRASCPSACASWTSNGRGSISARRSPSWTYCPSSNATFTSSPSTRLRTVTVLNAVTVRRAPAARPGQARAARAPRASSRLRRGRLWPAETAATACGSRGAPPRRAAGEQRPLARGGAGAAQEEIDHRRRPGLQALVSPAVEGDRADHPEEHLGGEASVDPAHVPRSDRLLDDLLDEADQPRSSPSAAGAPGCLAVHREEDPPAARDERERTVDHLLERAHRRDRGGRRLGEVAAEPLDAVEHDGAVQGALAAEVPVDGALADAGGAGDVGDRHLVVVAVCERLLGRAQDGRPSAGDRRPSPDGSGLYAHAQHSGPVSQ